jgi:hypothetical protein
MPTLTVTREVGVALLHLRDGHAICKTWTDKYVLCLTSTTSGQIEIADETFQELRKAKLIRKYDRFSDPYRWYVNWYGRSRTWLLSDAGNPQIKMPRQGEGGTLIGATLFYMDFRLLQGVQCNCNFVVRIIDIIPLMKSDWYIILFFLLALVMVGLHELGYAVFALFLPFPEA